MTKKIQERIEKKLGNLNTLRQRYEEKENYFVEILLLLLLFLVHIFLKTQWVTIVLSVVFGVTIFWILNNKIHHRQHNHKLRVKILAKEEY